MPGFDTTRRQPFVLDTESTFSRPHRRPNTGLCRRNKPRKHSGIIHIGHGNRSPSGSPVGFPEGECILPWSETDDGKVDKTIDEESARQFWSVNASQNQRKFTSEAPDSSQDKGETPKNDQYQRKLAILQKPGSCAPSDTRKPNDTGCISQKKDNIRPGISVSKETQESLATTKTDVQLSSCASTLQVFSNTQAGKLSHFISDLYGHDRMTDIKIHVGSYGFNAHKVVLACFSPYFSNILLNSNKVDEYVLSKNITPTGFKKILDFMYTEELTIEVENVAEILQAADILQITELQDKCYVILKAAEPSALIDILEMSHKQGVRYICENVILSKLSRVFNEICHTDGLLELCSECLCLLLCRDDLVVESEYDVALTAANWVSHNAEEGLKLLGDVFSFVRFQNMTSNELLQLGQEAPFLMGSKETAEQILKIHWSRRSIELGMTDCLCIDSQQPRNYKTKKSLKEETQQSEKGRCEKISANNNNSKSTRKPSKYVQKKLREHSSFWHEHKSTTNQYKPEEGDGRELENVPRLVAIQGIESSNVKPSRKILSLETSVQQQKIIKIGDSAYLIGGTIDNIQSNSKPKPTNRVVKIDLATSESCEWFPMWDTRYLHSVTSIENTVYTIGGVSSNGESLRSIECLEHGHTQYGWKRVCNMPSPRCGAAVTSFSEKLFIAGGSQEASVLDHILDSVLSYDTKLKQWSEIDCLRSPRFGASMVTDNKKLYIVGGITSDGNKKSVVPDMDVWDGKIWMKRARLQKARFHSSSFVNGSSCIVILGGYANIEDTRNVVQESEIFNISKKVWESGSSFSDTINNNLYILL